MARQNHERPLSLKGLFLWRGCRGRAQAESRSRWHFRTCSCHSTPADWVLLNGHPWPAIRLTLRAWIRYLVACESLLKQAVSPVPRLQWCHPQTPSVAVRRATLNAGARAQLVKDTCGGSATQLLLVILLARGAASLQSPVHIRCATAFALKPDGLPAIERCGVFSAGVWPD